MSARSLVVALAMSCGLIAPAAAQRPGDELPGYDRSRQEYLLNVLGALKEVLEKWRQEHATPSKDQKALPRMLTDDVFYSPVEGWTVQGRDLVRDSLVARIPRMKGYHTTMLDFTASGSLAYCLGRLTYQLDEQGTSRSVVGTFSMVLWLDGRNWRIRSYLEREER
jgi:ketosteroid isomerase-like protein